MKGWVVHGCVVLLALCVACWAAPLEGKGSELVQASLESSGTSNQAGTPSSLAQKLKGKKLLFLGDSMMRQDMGYAKCVVDGQTVTGQVAECDQKTHDQLHLTSLEGADQIRFDYYWAPSMWQVWDFFKGSPYNTEGSVLQDPVAEVNSADVVFVAVAGCSDKDAPDAAQLDAFTSLLSQVAGNKLILRLPGAQDIASLGKKVDCAGQDKSSWFCQAASFTNNDVEQFAQQARQTAEAKQIKVVDTFEFSKGDQLASKFSHDDGGCHFLGDGRRVGDIFLQRVSES